MTLRPLAAVSAIVFLFAGVAEASGGLPMATEWSWARDGGRIFNSLVVLGFIAWLVVKYGGPVFRNRMEKIANRFSSLEKQKEEARARLVEYQKKLVEAKAEAEKISSEARAEGELIKKKIIEQAQEAAREIMEKTGDRIKLETESARERLRKEAVEAAVSLAEEILKKNLGAEDQKKLIKSYLEKVEKVN